MQCLSDIFTEWYHRWPSSSKDVYLYYPTCTENKIHIALDTALDYYTKMKKWCRSFLSITGKKNHSRKQQYSWLHWWLVVYPKCIFYEVELFSLGNQLAKCTGTVETSSGQQSHKLTSVDNVFQYSLTNQMFTFRSQHEMLKNISHCLIFSEGSDILQLIGLKSYKLNCI